MKNSLIAMIGLMTILSGCGSNTSTTATGPQGATGATGTTQTGPQGATGVTGAQGPAGAAAPTATPVPTPDAVQTVVNNYNEYLFSQGSDPLTQGLRCTLYTVPNMPATPCLLATSIAGCTTVSSSVGYATIGSFTYTGAINQPNEAGTAGFNVLPQALQALYPTNFAVTCTGYFVNPDYNYHEFDVSSDDGSLLYIGGSLIVNNDGEHGMANVKAEKYLQAQVYSFQLNYFQGPGNVALIVNMDGNVLPAENLWH